MTTTLMPRLVVSDVDAAISFYREALSCELLERYAEPSGHVVHAAMQVDSCRFSLTQEKQEWGLSAPVQDASPVLLYVLTASVDEMVKGFLDAGGKTLIPLDDRFYGHREGRFRDPFGHLWIFSQIIETLTEDEVNARMK